MNEIIATVITGLPYTALVFAFTLGILLYACMLSWLINHEKVRIAAFIIVIPLFLFIVFISYVFGAIK